MYALIATGGKQYKVNIGDVVYIEKLNNAADEIVNFDVMMYVDGEVVKVGSPILDDVKVSGKVIRHVKGKKIIVFKYKRKKNIRKKQGHRQPYTAVEITGMGPIAATEE